MSKLKKTNSGKQFYAMSGRNMHATKEAWEKIFKKMGWEFNEDDLIPVYED